MLWPPPRPSCTEVITRTAWTLDQLQKLLVTSHNKTLYFKLIASLHHSNEHALIFNNTIPRAVEPPRQGPDLIHLSAALVGLQGPGVPELLHLRRKRLEDRGPLSAEQQQGFPRYERMMRCLSWLRECDRKFSPWSPHTSQSNISNPHPNPSAEFHELPFLDFSFQN